MKVRRESYKIEGLGRSYQKLVKSLRAEAMLHSSLEDADQFYMPGGKVAIQLRKYAGDITILDIKRTTFFMPKYVYTLLQEISKHSQIEELSYGKRGVLPEDAIPWLINEPKFELSL